MTNLNTDMTAPTMTATGHSVTVYGQPGCQPCKATTRTLDRAGVPHHYEDVSLDPSMSAYIRDTYGPSTPVVEVKDPDTGQVQAAWTGFRVESCKALAHEDTDLAPLDQRG